MIHLTHLKLHDDRFAILYRFDKRGEGIPMHSHERVLEHDVSCTRGRVVVHGESLEAPIELHAGERLLFDSSLPHEIVALEDRSSVLNEFTYGQPMDYAALPAEELDTSVTLGPVKWNVGDDKASG